MANIRGYETDGVEYRYIDQAGRQMVAVVENTSTATAAHAVGTYLIYNDTLYKVTAAIAVGGTLTVGTNIAAMPGGLGADVAALKSAVTLFTGNQAYTDYTRDYWIKYTAPQTKAHETGWESILVACNPGDVFNVKGYGGASPRLWCFSDSNGAALTYADAATIANDFIEITAPENAAYLACNSKYTEFHGELVFGKFINKNINELGTSVAAGLQGVSDKVNATDKYFNDKLDTVASFSKNLLVLTSGQTTGALQSDGTISTAGSYANYVTSDYIELDPNRTYSVAVVTKSDASNKSNARRILLCYDKNKNIVNNSFQNGFDVYQVANIPYIRVSCEASVVSSAIIGAVLMEGTTISEYADAYSQPINKMKIVSGYGAAMQADFDELGNDLQNVYSIEISDNLADPSQYSTGGIQNDGSISTAGSWANYITTELIPLESNKDYTISLWSGGSLIADRIVYLLYSDENTPVSATFYNNASYNHVTFNSLTYKYVRISCGNSRNLMFAQGTSYNEFEEYYKRYVINGYLGDSALKQVENVVNGDDAGQITVKKDNDTIEVVSKINNQTLKRVYKLQANGNQVFNFGSAYLGSTEIKTSGDDITPIRVRMDGSGNEGKTVGANHGWPFAYVGDNNGGFDASDIGSIWTDGTTQYTMLSASESSIGLVPPVTKSDNVISCTMIAPAADLTHVSGATHTSSIAKASLSSGQIYPSVNHHSLAIILDGKPITENGTYYPNDIEVQETYGIMDLYELYTYARSNVGSVDLDEVQTICTMTIAVKITDNAEIVYTNLKADEIMQLGNCGFIQANNLYVSTGTLYRYINGVDSGTFASTSLVDMSSYNMTTIIYPADVRQDQVPNRSVDVCINNGNVLYGFALGYIPDMGDGADSKRIQLDRLWDMRNTKKSYPVCVYGKSLASGDQVNVIGYRAYFGAITGATDVFTVKVGGKKYVVFDAHSKVSGAVSVGKLGDSVATVNNDGMTVGDFVNANGLPYSASGNYSAFVAKL